MSADTQRPEHEETVQGRAYGIWERDGRPDGKHLDHWQQAEQELAAELAMPSAPSSSIIPGTQPKKRAAQAA